MLATEKRLDTAEIEHTDKVMGLGFLNKKLRD